MTTGWIVSILCLFLAWAPNVRAQQTPEAMKDIVLNQPDQGRGESVMQALAKRRSTRVFADKPLTLQDLSDLLWAANGINRPAEGRRTAPSALNRQDIRVYVCLESGNYLYDPHANRLQALGTEDVRPDGVPVCLVLVSDADEAYSGIDAGIVSQNISLFCSGVGLATYPRATMDRSRLQKTLKLSGSQKLQLCHPVGYFE